ncbi:hypothetical protein BC936DRAFT_149324, partial [Jimgerdemannia flammicorona]
MAGSGSRIRASVLIHPRSSQCMEGSRNSTRPRV